LMFSTTTPTPQRNGSRGNQNPEGFKSLAEQEQLTQLPEIHCQPKENRPGHTSPAHNGPETHTPRRGNWHRFLTRC
jgi:hypothetical protein